MEHEEFCDGAVADLVARGAARCVTYKPHGVSPLRVAVHARTLKKRLVFNLRPLNPFLVARKFKYEGVDTVKAVARPGDCAFSVDLSAAYHHVDMAQRYWRYLGFLWKGDYYEFCSLPFGLAPACRIFTYIVRALAQHWRSQGIRLVHYIDDWVFFCRPEEHSFLVAKILADIAAAGFIINKIKSHGLEEPTFHFTWIGYSFNLATGEYGVLPHHVEHLKEQCTALLSLRMGQKLKSLQLMQVLGKLASASKILGATLRMYTFFLN